MNKLFASFAERNRKPDVAESDLFENKKFNKQTDFYDLTIRSLGDRASIINTVALENNLYYIILRDSEKDFSYYGFLQEKSPEILALTVFSDLISRRSEAVVFVRMAGNDHSYFGIRFFDQNSIMVTAAGFGSYIERKDGKKRYFNSENIFSSSELSKDVADLEKLFVTNIFDFYYRNILDLPTDFPDLPQIYSDYPLDKILYRKNIDPMIAGIAMIDIPVETV